MKVAVVLMGLMLVLGTVTLLNIPYAASQSFNLTEGRMATNLELEMSGCTNSVTCNAELFVGDEVEIIGILTDDDGEPIQGAEVTVYKFVPKPELIPIASGVTGIDGDITLTWVVEFTPTERAPDDVTRKFLSETVTIFAQFDGDEQYAPSKSGKNTAVITVNKLSTFVNSDKNLYNQGDEALVFIAFIDSNDEFVDPDSLRVVLNDKEVQVEKKKTGSYTLTIPPLPKEHTQLFIIPKKEGFNIDNGFLTLIVDGLK